MSVYHYDSMTLRQYTSIPVCQYTSMTECQYTSMTVHQYDSMPPQLQYAASASPLSTLPAGGDVAPAAAPGHRSVRRTRRRTRIGGGGMEDRGQLEEKLEDREDMADEEKLALLAGAGCLPQATRTPLSPPPPSLPPC